MSLITRCPACQTLFKVVPDQLRISEGWVRCGQCDEVFDASIHLLPDTQAVEPAPVDINLDSVPLSIADDVLIEPEPEPEPIVASPADFTQATLSGYRMPDDEDAGTGIEFNDVSFLRDKHVASFWHKPSIRITLALLSLVLLLALLGQIVFNERDRIAASAPGLKPWLLVFCGPLHCSLSPVRKIEAIVIDSATFTKIRGNAYRLNFTLKSNELMVLALPAIEFTLTDTLDQPVIRRVFRPEELGVKLNTLAAGGELTVSLAIAVNDAGASDRVTGYRVLAFYP